uniref:GRIP domain-containing protein n=1 Tax=Peronospora matthiolae TaxID=2874970 RepID=A0AAV1USN5_9STRA
MWSRLAEGLADIVAPEEGYAQQIEDTTDPDLVLARSDASSPFVYLNESAASPATVKAEEDEQEQYIRDLERALIQQKKQNRALEDKVKKIKIKSRQADEDKKEAQFMLQSESRDQEVEIAPRQQINTNAAQYAEHDDIRTLQTKEERVSRVKYDRLVQELQQSQTEVNTLTTKCQDQEKELASLRDQVEVLRVANETLQQDEQEIRVRAAEYEQGYVNLLEEIEKMKTTNEEKKMTLISKSKDHEKSIDSQRLYDLEAQLATAEADKALAQLDAERLQRDLNALEDVLHQFQMDNKAYKARIIILEAELEQATSTLQSCQPLSKPFEGECNDFERLMEKLEKKSRECEQLREALERTATQYTSERGMVDQRLAAQLVVAYVDSDKKGDILHLMARILDFTEDQKRRVGVGYPIEGNGGGGIFSSIIGLVAPGGESASIDPSAIEGKKFTDLWSDFLLDESSNKS